jgi:hypothetical protein
MLKMRAIYNISKQIKPKKTTDDRRKFSLTETIHIAALFDAVTSSIEADYHVGIKILVSAHGTSVGIILSFLHKILGPQRRGLEDNQRIVAGTDGKESGDLCCIGYCSG